MAVNESHRNDSRPQVVEMGPAVPGATPNELDINIAMESLPSTPNPWLLPFAGEIEELFQARQVVRPFVLSVHCLFDSLSPLVSHRAFHADIASLLWVSS